MPKQPDEFAVHLFLSGGNKEEVRFINIQDFQKWYSSELVAKADSNQFINVPIKNIQGEYMVVRPCHIVAVRVEPVFYGSVDREF